MRNKILFTIFALLGGISSFSQGWSTLEKGKHDVGFKIIRTTSSAGNPMLISIWYPAKKGTETMKLEDYVKIGGPVEKTPDAWIEEDFGTARMMATRLYRIPDVTKEQYMQAISGKTDAYRDADALKGKYPLIIGLSTPATYFSTAEFLASHGFVFALVASRFPDSAPSPETPYHYQRYTDLVGELMDYMIKQPNVQGTDIITFGHGFSTQPAVYLAMRGDKRIKKVINLDGGFFSPMSKSTVSIDYHPEKLSAPMLHIITAGTAEEENAAEVNALKGKAVVAKFKTPNMMHHDFTSWGRLISAGFKKRSNNDEINNAFKAAHDAMLQFLQNKPVTSQHPDLLEVYKLN